MSKHIAVLMGGISSERDVSLASGQACAEALKRLGHKVTLIDIKADNFSSLFHLKCDVIFNALHGSYGEDGRMQGLFELLQIPYTHSGVLASALAMDKQKAKAVVREAGVPVARSVVMNRFDISSEHILPPPYVIKPVSEGSSFGVLLVKKGDNVPLDILTAKDWPYGNLLMVESYVAGQELTCAIMGQKALAVCEILINNASSFYDHEAKYQTGGSEHICPAKVSSNIYQLVQKYALLAHNALGCKGVTRSDFRYDAASGELIWLEINTQPGMTQTSLVPDLARHEGLSFEDLVQYIVEDALCRS